MLSKINEKCERFVLKHLISRVFAMCCYIVIPLDLIYVCPWCNRNSSRAIGRKTFFSSQKLKTSMRHAGQSVTGKQLIWDLKPKLQSLCMPHWDWGMAGNLRAKALIDKVASPLWHNINLISNPIALFSISIEPCVSITNSIWTTC